MTTSPPSPTGYIPTLDGWRAVAVLLVIGAHSSRMLKETGNALAARIAAFFEHAGYGVDIFFAISGFLICSLLLREKEHGEIALTNFYVRRFFRIVPAIVPYLLVIGALQFAGRLPGADGEMLGVMFFYRNYIEGSWYTGHFWSLGVEEHFYLLVPVALALCERRTALRLALLMAALCVLIRCIEARYMTGKVEFHTESRFDALMYGCVLAIVMSYQHGREFIQRRVTATNLFALISVAVALCFLVHAMPFRRAVIAMLIPLVLGFTVVNSSGLLGKALEMPWLRWVGRLSYSLYIWQMLFLVPIVDIPVLQSSIPVSLATAFGCAILSYYLVEQPAIALGRRLVRARPRPLLESSSSFAN